MELLKAIYEDNKVVINWFFAFILGLVVRKLEIKNIRKKNNRKFKSDSDKKF